MSDTPEDLDTKCWCKPEVRHYESGGTLVIHNSADGRELIERHGLQ